LSPVVNTSISCRSYTSILCCVCTSVLRCFNASKSRFDVSHYNTVACGKSREVCDNQFNLWLLSTIAKYVVSLSKEASIASSPPRRIRDLALVPMLMRVIVSGLRSAISPHLFLVCLDRQDASAKRAFFHQREKYRNENLEYLREGKFFGSVDRVARRPCDRLALSELGVKVSLHPAQVLRTPRGRRRGFERGRRWR